MQKIDIHLHPMKDDPQLDNYIEQMDKGNVVAGLVHGYFAEWATNKNVLKLVERHKGRLFGSACLDFRNPVTDVIAEMKDYAAAGFKSIKLFPNYGYHPSDPQYDKIWDKVEELGLMCLSHCGWLGDRVNPMRDVDQLTARPFCFERAARNHQGVNFVMAHFGGGAFYLETCVLTLRLSNFFADTCPGWGRWVFDNRLPGLTSLDFNKIVYGTDNAWDYVKDEETWIVIHKSMGRSQEDLERYFFRNSARLLKLEDKLASPKTQDQKHASKKGSQKKKRV